MSDKNHKDITTFVKNTAVKPDPVIKTFSRNDLLQANGEIIKQLQARIRGKRFRVQEGDLVKIQYMKTLIYALRCANEILKDIQLEEFDERLKTLEEIYNTGSVTESMQAGSLAEDQDYNLNLESLGPESISEFEEQT
jgi:hypothetical protein